MTAIATRPHKDDSVPLIQVTLIEGAFTAPQKQEIVERLTDATVEIEGETGRSSRARLTGAGPALHEIPIPQTNGTPMTSRRITLVGTAAVILLAALAIVGCGSGSSSGASATAAAAKSASGQAATIGVASTGLGKILVDSKGRSLYLFKKDTGTNSACNGECATDWPPVRANGKPTLGGGVNASLVATTTRSDGTPQVTYNGHPLYLFEGDQKRGDTNRQGSTAFGAAWYALSPSGNQISGQASSSSGGASSAGGGTSGY
jgi:predicted lipoprotein with Yx(FWY)xxD motif